MQRVVRMIGAVGFLGMVTVGLVPLGCGTGLGQVTVRQNGSDGDDALPRITVERLQACVAEFGGQLEPRSYGFHPEIQVDEDGVKWAVTTDDIPASASDFAGCTRSVLSDMPVSADLIRKGAEELKIQRAQASAETRSLMGSPVVIVVAGVVIVVSEVMLEAGAITILFAVTVKVLDKAVDDVEEQGWKAVCIAKYAACMMTRVGDAFGNHWRNTRCEVCMARCKIDHSWPSQIGDGSCEYWERGWGR